MQRKLGNWDTPWRATACSDDGRALHGLVYCESSMEFVLSAHCGTTLRFHRRRPVGPVSCRGNRIGPSSMRYYPNSAMVEIFAGMTRDSATLTGS